MSEDKKPKIDLKARLGKKTVSAPATGPGGSIPPPAGIPKPNLGGGSGIPAPPFQGAAARSAPVVDASNPYGAMEPAAAVVAQPAAIKIELSDEVVRAQSRGKTKVLVLAVITAIIGGFVGFTLGGTAERGKGQDAALQGAADLSKEVEEANKKIEELANVIKAAKEKLGKAQFPDEEVSKLGALNIPFAGANLSGKGIGRFKQDLLTMLVNFASASSEANENKQDLQIFLSGNKKGVVEFLESQTKPKVRWSIIVGGSPMGPIASMQPVPAPFLLTSDEKGKSYSWPDSYELPGQGGKKETIKRYTKGDPAGEDATFIPVDPSTQGLVCPSDTLVKIRQRLISMEESLRGDHSDPTNEKDGLLEAGQNLLRKLKEIGKTAPG